MKPWTLTDIAEAVRASWAADTCSPDDLAWAGWTGDNPALGHCDITSLVVNDLFGGDLVVGEVHLGAEQRNFHWWNRLPSGIEIDLTYEQFRLGEVVSEGRIVARPTGRPAPRWDEYELFRDRVWRRLGGTPPQGGASQRVAGARQ